VKTNNSSRIETIYQLGARLQYKESEYKSLKDSYEVAIEQKEEQVIHQFNSIKNYAERLTKDEINKLSQKIDQLKTDIEHLPILSNTVSCPKKEELRNQLISLMVPIICWKEFPGFRNPEWATSITKGRHIIEDLRLKHLSSLDKNYIDNIWNVCFKRAKELTRAEIGSKKNERSKSQ
jgi:Domain of unknown function DUF29